MSFAFAVAKDAVRTTVQSYVLYSGSPIIASGTGQLFPVPTPTAPILFIIITTATYATYPENYATYQATGISGDTSKSASTSSRASTTLVASAQSWRCVRVPSILTIY